MPPGREEALDVAAAAATAEHNSPSRSELIRRIVINRLKGRGFLDMTDRSKSPARAKADSQFDAAQSQARAREKDKPKLLDRAGEQDERTARLKAQRLARDAEIGGASQTAPKTNAIKGWGDLNKALNALVREGVILSYTTARPEKGAPAGIEVATAKGADQAEVVRRVREQLTGDFSEATVRTRAA